jgi:hypothetical protein
MRGEYTRARDPAVMGGRMACLCFRQSSLRMPPSGCRGQAWQRRGRQRLCIRFAARRPKLVMPVTAHSMTDKAPARAWTRESPNRMAVALRPSAETDGCAIRSKTGFARTQPWPARSVSSTRLLIERARALSSSRLCRRRWRSCYEGYETWLNSMPRGTEVHVGVLSAAA